MAKVTFDYSKAAPFINEDELNVMEAQDCRSKKTSGRQIRSRK